MIFTLALVTMLSLNVFSKNHPIAVRSISSNIFYFKVDKQYVGATIEIMDLNGNVLQSATINSRKIIIDFFYKMPGKYIIVIKKGDLSECFEYENLDMQVKEAGKDEVLIVQE